MHRIGHSFLKGGRELLRDRLLVGLVVLGLIAGIGLVVESKLKMAYEKDGLQICLICSHVAAKRS